MLAFEIPVKQFLLFIVKAVNPIKISVHVQKMRLHDLYAQYWKLITYFCLKVLEFLLILRRFVCIVRTYGFLEYI